MSLGKVERKYAQDKGSQTDRRREGLLDGRTDERMDGRTDGQTDGALMNVVNPWQTTYYYLNLDVSEMNL